MKNFIIGFLVFSLMLTAIFYLYRQNAMLEGKLQQASLSQDFDAIGTKSTEDLVKKMQEISTTTANNSYSISLLTNIGEPQIPVMTLCQQDNNIYCYKLGANNELVQVEKYV